jgi:hypothetical protein
MASIRKRKGKKGTRWFAEVRLSGQAPQRKSFDTQGEAKSWAKEREVEVANGHRPSSAKHTLTWLVDDYLEERTVDKNGQQILAWWKDQLGSKRISELHRDDFIQARKKLYVVRPYGTI